MTNVKNRYFASEWVFLPENAVKINNLFSLDKQVPDLILISAGNCSEGEENHGLRKGIVETAWRMEGQD